MKLKTTLLVCCLTATTLGALAKEASKLSICKTKISQLEKLVKQANKLNLDTQREEGAIWMANTFLFYAKWDEKNVESNVYQFSSWPAYADDATRMARELPDFERSQVIELLDESIEELTDVINGDIVRRPVPRIDWTSITLDGDKYISNGRPVFINDYGSRPACIANDYCGSLNKAGLGIDYINYPSGEMSERAKSMFAKDNGNSGYVLMSHGVPPKYLLDQDPHIMDGGRHFTRYDIDNPLIRESWERVFEVMIPQMKDYSGTEMGYVLANEPHFFTQKDVWATGEVSQHTKDKFKVWLKNQHKDINRLNELWGTNFASFDDVTIEIPFDGAIRTQPMGYDWYTFNQDRVTEWFQFLKDGIRKYDPEAVIHIKLIPRIFRQDIRDHGMDFESLMNMCDVLGNDAKIQGRLINSKGAEPWEKYYAYDWFEVGVAYDFYESVSPNKTNFNSESHYLSSAGWREMDLTADRVRSSYWLATLQGMSVSHSWFWAREKDGGPRYDLRAYQDREDSAMAKAYPGSVAQQPIVANAVSKTYMEFNAYGPELMGLLSEKRPVRLFYSKVSAIKNPTYMATMLDLYTPLFFDGLPVGFATKGVIENHDNSLWDVIMVRETEFLTIEEFDALQKYLDNGGTVILDSKSLKKNEYGEPLNRSLESSNGVIYNLESVEEFIAKGDEILAANGSNPRVTLKESNDCGSEGCLWRSYAKDKDTTILCIVNIGRGDATLELTSDKGLATIKNLFTGKSAKSNFTLKSQDVIMLEVGHKFDDAFNF